ncbi:hypothetical protein Agub_g5115 [Astrephomene gubernaculifera]|uniref:Uncharacterized protein n=1 Tax=Astrephomene gubernaculifera TaxID=47775 RepID=A0AAD3HKI7_9CHLO|nr:hypothetical protein Agub_g5115 [Astrephomene gubernaculifera]
MLLSRQYQLLERPRRASATLPVPSWQHRTAAPTGPPRAPPLRSLSPTSSFDADTNPPPYDTSTSTSAPAAATRPHPPPPAGPSDRCFALETMSEDGQSWVLGELGSKLVGLRHTTPRAACRTTRLLGYHGNLGEGDKALRCDELDLDLGWEATCRGAEGSTFTGQAKVTLASRDKDVVGVAVRVDPACLQQLPEGGRGALQDVVYAVESLDTAIMEQLNDFLWSMEEHNERRRPAEEEEEEGWSGGGGGQEEEEASRAA